MNIWWYVVAGIFSTIIVVDIDSYLSLLQNLMIIIFTTLVSLYLIRFTGSQYGINSVSPDQVKFILLSVLSLVILVSPFLLIFRRLRRKIAERINQSLPNQSDNFQYWDNIFLLGWLTMRIFGELIPSLKDNWIFIIITFTFMISFFTILIRTPITPKKKTKY